MRLFIIFSAPFLYRKNTGPKREVLPHQPVGFVAIVAEVYVCCSKSELSRNAIPAAQLASSQFGEIWIFFAIVSCVFRVGSVEIKVHTAG